MRRRCGRRGGAGRLSTEELAALIRAGEGAAAEAAAEEDDGDNNALDDLDRAAAPGAMRPL